MVRKCTRRRRFQPIFTIIGTCKYSYRTLLSDRLINDRIYCFWYFIIFISGVLDIEARDKGFNILLPPPSLTKVRDHFHRRNRQNILPSSSNRPMHAARTFFFLFLQLRLAMHFKLSYRVFRIKTSPIILSVQY